VGASHQTGWTGCIARIIQADALFTNEVLTSKKSIEAHVREVMGQRQTAAAR